MTILDKIVYIVGNSDLLLLLSLPLLPLERWEVCLDQFRGSHYILESLYTPGR
jgi:hypothetical protein